jgi:hypothetical protein
VSIEADTPLITKLGFAPGDSVCVETTPDWYSQFANDNQLELEPGLPATHAHIFCMTKLELDDFLGNNDLSEVEKSIWISWPKKSSGLQSDLSDNDIRSALLPLGWVDSKVANLDDTWSGLKFTRRQA